MSLRNMLRLASLLAVSPEKDSTLRSAVSLHLSSPQYSLGGLLILDREDSVNALRLFAMILQSTFKSAGRQIVLNDCIDGILVRTI